MSAVIALGNGESRLGLDLEKILSNHMSVGCNAVVRDYSVDHLVCVDRRMVSEALELHQGPIYTRTDWLSYFSSNPKVQAVPDLPYKGELRADEPFHWGSGPYAILLAAQLADNEVWLIGFDLYGVDKKVNNIYKGTKNYVKHDSHAIDPSYWIHQTEKIFESYPDINFKIFNHNEWQLPVKWKKSNVEVLTYKYLQV